MSGILLNLSIDKKENSIINVLENLDLVINKLDIIGDPEGEIFLTGKLNIYNITNNEDTEGVAIDNFIFELYNGSTYVIGGEIPLSTDLFPAQQETSTILDFSIGLKNSSISELSNDFISLILNSNNFTLQMVGNIKYSKSLFQREISFTNSILFDLSANEKLDIEILDIIIPERDGNNTRVEIIILNPYGVDVKVSGKIDIYVENLYVGETFANSVKIMAKSTTALILNAKLDKLPKILIPEVFDNYIDGFNLIADLDINFGNIETNVQLDFIISTGTQSEVLEISLNEINDYQIDLDSGDIYLDFDIDLLYYIPLNLNLSEINLQMATLSQIYLGNSTWVSSEHVSLSFNKTAKIEGIKINFTGMSPFIMLSIAIEQKLLIQSGYIRIAFFDTFFDLKIPTTTINLG